ncbi:ABC transporter ATP-binding protein [Pyrobaculum aerophilum]|uniref:ATP-binding cassette domain-containing protein n=1 Tax=Pyrobaculum aerophilum TaxID=13773 RepID=UPI0023F5564C|nr:ABC transporter ATP-binding protein [Pyrobaculum aerophilum]MCX8136950.1 ABC transporter ATP-binding protein [Pyrobaculum aerophilum]
MLRYINVSYAVNGKTILRDVTLEINRGEAVALLGKSGAGKTTLLKIGAGILKPTSGIIERHVSRIGYIPQSIGLIEGATVLENVLIASGNPLGIFTGRWPRHLIEKAVQVLRQVGLGDRLREPVANLSGGEKQRVAIARALIYGAEIILADEPVSNLDLQTAEDVLKLLIAFKENGAVLAVLHDVDLAIKYFDKGYRLEGGKAYRIW